ncbi:hypothetical protein NH341_05665 [Tenacibaculum sp. XPcli2-G]|uniref:hypothetical protein n=1 Tax=Tenacibaculum sp. XPcli2-G TaxID=2954503 RepID=UPI002097C2B1|nr:hypothetical protein [Tenacibaculum sp. XPcli2-G]MCO7184903.1 hypothetical protein [Tenacibaculum sp. XPcli2-G]
MTIEELGILLKDMIPKDEYIYDTYEDETYIYAFTKLEKLRGIDFDDRYGKVGGPGPIRVNKKNKEFKRVSNRDVPSHYYDKNRVERTIDSIAKGIVKRKYVNFNNTYNFGKVLEDLKRETTDIISLQFKDEEIRDQLISFLEVINVECELTDDGWLFITRIPVK